MKQSLIPETRRVILWGGTGQAKVVRPLLEHYGTEVVAVFDDTPNIASPFPDVPLFHGHEGFMRWLGDGDRSDHGFVVAIGNPHGRIRLKLHEFLKSHGLTSVRCVHPTAWIDLSATIGEGAQIMAGAIVLAHAHLGTQVIVNTRASVDHEDVLEDGVEIAPGATLCGLVHCEINAWICAGATVLPRLRIGADAIVGAGAVVVTDVPSGSRVVGVPARPMQR